MDEVYVHLSRVRDPAKECGMGFWVKKDEIETIQEIAKRNRLYLLIENEFDFTEEGFDFTEEGEE